MSACRLTGKKLSEGMRQHCSIERQQRQDQALGKRIKKNRILWVVEPDGLVYLSGVQEPRKSISCSSMSLSEEEGHG
jgi:hypothetical protein